MAGSIVDLWTARDFAYPDLATGQVQWVTYPVTRLLAFREAWLLVRVHHVDIDGPGTLHVVTHPVARSPGGRLFVNTDTSASVEVTDGSSGRLLRVGVPLTIMGADVQVTVLAQKSAGAPSTIEARLSASFFGRRSRAPAAVR
jgi:hypothetical protein